MKYWQALLYLVSSIFYPALGQAVLVTTVSDLDSAINSANSGGDKTIIIAAGTYHLDGAYFRLLADNITVAGYTGNHDDVVLDGDYVTTEIFQVVGSSVTIKDMTLKRAVYHPIHVFPEGKDVTGTLIQNVHIIDPGQQAIKINQDGAKLYSARNGTVRNSLIELTATGRAKVWEINDSCYTGGVDGHHAIGWLVTGNTIKNFWCEGGLSEHGVHFWSQSVNSKVTRNHIINCDRGIGFGLGSSGHSGGEISNNMIYHDTGHAYSDVGIGLESALNVKVVNNTIFHEHSYANAIEYRFAVTTGTTIYNNLTNRAISSRDGGSAALGNNVTGADATWFVDSANGNLHLAGYLENVVDAGTYLADLTDDFDGEPRPQGSGFDIGADELMYQAPPPRTIQPAILMLLLNK